MKKTESRHGVLTKCGCLPLLASAAFLCALVASTSAQAFDLDVVDQDGNAVQGFKWLLEEDNTHPAQPGVHLPVSDDVNENTLSISLHKSHAASIATGFTDQNSVAITCVPLPGGCPDLPAGRYFVSVLPYGTADTTYDLGGSPIDTRPEIERCEVQAGGTVECITIDNPNFSNAVTVHVRATPLETAQIFVKVFKDTAPLNNAPDIASEDGLQGFTVTLMDAAGDVLQDAFANPLGTTYMRGDDVCTNFLSPNSDVCDDNLDGAPDILQDGSLVGDFITDSHGEVLIQNLAPNKYGVQVEPPTVDGMGSPVHWYLTSTIEGSPTVDAWVRPNEPPYLIEVGPPAWHVFYGYVKAFNNLGGGGTTTVSGEVRKQHTAQPPSIANFPGAPPSTSACLVALNLLQGTVPEAVYMDRCGEEGVFSIPGVPPGEYQLVIWDVFLTHIISFSTVSVEADSGDIDLGLLATPMWFGEQEHWVYYDANKNGIRDDGEVGIPEQNVNLRFRDGTINQAFPTDREGYVPFEEVFPFFHWQVAEVDFARLRATGLSVVVDQGGPVTDDADGESKRNGSLETWEPGPVLLSGYQQFAGQNTRFEWGKAVYDFDVNVLPLDDFPGPGDTNVNAAQELLEGNETYDNNGGISGIIYHATTRAEDDPAFAAGEEWEPGIPRVQVNLYRDQYDNAASTPTIKINPDGSYGDGLPDPVDANGNPDPAGFPHLIPTFADVDNYPFGWQDGGTRGMEDIDHDDDGVFDAGDAIRVVHSDSWDDDLPEGCNPGELAPVVPSVHGTKLPESARCFDGLRTWNQARPALFDGGYAFGPQDPLLVPGGYLVEAVAPPSYKHIKEEDRNVDFGLTPIPAILPPPCAGEDHLVPDFFTFATKDGSGNGAELLPWVDPDEVRVPAAGLMRPLCDRKKVTLGSRQNAAAEFWLMHDVPKAARGVGILTEDLTNELNPGNPNFPEKYAPPWISVAIFDYTGQEIERTYSDEFGAFNFLAPSSYAIDLPTPTGVGSKMHLVCLNDPGPIPDPATGELVTDPFYRPQLTTSCYTLNFEPGRTTYLDTPVFRIAAFATSLQQTLDCEAPQGTPEIRRVSEVGTGMPAYVSGLPGSMFSIVSRGTVNVPNPAYPGVDADGFPADPPTEPQFVGRNYRFGGTKGKVRVGSYSFPDNAVSWNNNAIIVTVPNNALQQGLQTGQLVVTTAPTGTGQNQQPGKSTRLGVTLTVGMSEGGNILRVGPGQAHTTIQAAIDAANPDGGDLILVSPGIYRELPVVTKRVRIQGAGAGSTVLDASQYSLNPASTSPLELWLEWVEGHMADIGWLNGQDPTDPLFFATNGEGPGFFVAPTSEAGFAGGVPARIDGFTIRNGNNGGGIYVNAYAHRLQISNNRIESNWGNLAGGVRIGNPTVLANAPGAVVVTESPNYAVEIRRNEILHNGSDGIGGGIGIYKGAESYDVLDNAICGNLGMSGGGGIAHRGLSENGLIARNQIVFNEAFQGDQPGTGLGIGGGGGGLEIAGDQGAGGGLSEGTGYVRIERNLFQGNLGGAADGGAIALRSVNGADVSGSEAGWHRIQIFNNMIVNNVTGLAGAGISLQDAVRVDIVHNTVAHNDSAATAAFAFQNGVTNPTTPQVAGIVSRAHSTLLAAALPATELAYSNPDHLLRNILWQNRSFYWDNGDLLPDPAGAYHDLGVIGTAQAACLDPRESYLTSATCDDGVTAFHGSNDTTGLDPRFSAPGAGNPAGDYLNDLTTAAAVDEGGNFVQVYYSPLFVKGDYHLRVSNSAQQNSLARDRVSTTLPQDQQDLLNTGRLVVDYDGQARPAETGNNAPETPVDLGADEAGSGALVEEPVLKTLADPTSKTLGGSSSRGTRLRRRR